MVAKLQKMSTKMSFHQCNDIWKMHLSCFVYEQSNIEGSGDIQDTSDATRYVIAESKIKINANTEVVMYFYVLLSQIFLAAINARFTYTYKQNKQLL